MTYTITHVVTVDVSDEAAALRAADELRYRTGSNLLSVKGVTGFAIKKTVTQNEDGQVIEEV